MNGKINHVRGFEMKKITLFTCAMMLFSNCLHAIPANAYDNLSPHEIKNIEDSGTLYAPPEGALYLQTRNDLYNFYDNLSSHDMISVNNETNTAKIEGFVFLNNFEYEVDIIGIAASLLDLCTSHDKFSTAKAKLEEWQQNLIKNRENEKLYQDEEYIRFVQLFSDVFFKTTTEKLSHFDVIEFDLGFVYIDPDNCCTKFLQNIRHYIALASDHVTTIQELFVKNSFIKGKYKYKKESGTKFKLIAVE